MTAVFAHRGASAHHPENTVEAFAAAGPLGATGIELDVRPGPNDRLLVHHDPLPEEVPDSVPTLAAALEACGDLLVNVELKVDHPRADAGFVAAVLEVVAGWGGEVLLSSFDDATVDECRRQAPQLRTAQLTWLPSRPFADLVDDIRDRGHAAWHPHHLIVDEATMALARGADLEVNTWTVDDPVRMIELARLGVDGIVTNDVPAAVAALR